LADSGRQRQVVSSSSDLEAENRSSIQRRNWTHSSGTSASLASAVPTRVTSWRHSRERPG